MDSLLHAVDKAASHATTTDVVPPLPPAAAKTTSNPNDDTYCPPQAEKRVETKRTDKVHKPVSEGSEKIKHGKRRAEGVQEDSSVQSPARKSSRAKR